MLTLGWSGEMRRALMSALTDEQRAIVIDRIHLEHREHRIEQEERYETTLFVRTHGAEGASYGLPEWICATVFGSDPAFRDTWQTIRRMDGTVTEVPPVRVLPPTGLELAAKLHGNLGKRRKKK